MKLEDHEQMTIQLLGEPFTAVHLWLDELFPRIGARHRRVRHHLQGIVEVRRRWGNVAAEAARLHIIDDLKGEGWVEGKDRIPADEADYIKMGLF
jgi:DNA-binding GntR family transcriptional regulator